MVEEKANISGELELKHYNGDPTTGTLVYHAKIFRKKAAGGGSIEEVQPV